MYTTTKQARCDTTAHDNSRYREVFTHDTWALDSGLRVESHSQADPVVPKLIEAFRA